MITKTLLHSFLILSLLSGIAAQTSRAADKSQTKLEAKAKVTRAQAEKTIHRLWREGKIESVELEKENGKLIWSFDISIPDSKDIIEAQVDAKTGKVVSVEIETPAAQKKEAAADAKEGKARTQLKKSGKEDNDKKDVKASKQEKKAKKKSDKEEDDEKDGKK